MQYGARGGPEFSSRLPIARTKPDFEITFSADCWNVVQGNSLPVQVSCRRFGGFDGPIELAFEGLPDGVIVNRTYLLSPR